MCSYGIPVSGSIYLLAEPAERLQGRRVNLNEVVPLFRRLPYGTCCLLEEAESIVVGVARDERRPFSWSVGEGWSTPSQH